MLRKLLAIGLMLCLPLQAAAALAASIDMALVPPLARPSSLSFAPAAQISQAQDSHDIAHCDHAQGKAAVEGDHSAAEHAPAGQGGGMQGHGSCESCGVCHLASGAATPAVTGVAVMAPVQSYLLPAPQQYASHIPEQPQRPPRAR